MVAPVRVGDHSRRRFDQLRADLAVALGRDVTAAELFDMLVDIADEERERLVARAAGVRLPLSKREKTKVLSTGTDWGVPTSSDDIDRFLYGKGSARRRRERSRSRRA